MSIARQIQPAPSKLEQQRALLGGAKADPNGLPALVMRASQRLADAKTSAEVLEVKAAAEAALAYAKVTGAANETHADCLRIITRAEIRMAGEIDKGQEIGQVAKPGRKANVPASDNKATLAELGVSRQRVGEWRKVAEAGEEKVEGAISEALADGRAPTKADVHRAAGIVKDKPKPARNGYDALVEAWSAATPEDREAFIAYLRVCGYVFVAEPADAAVTAGNDLREPAAAAPGQIIREGDAPRETDRLGGAASRPDTKLKSDGDAIAAGKGRARLANAAGVEPPPSVSHSSAPTPAPEQTDRPAPPPSAPADYLNPICQKPDTCKWARSQASCSKCSNDAMKAKVAA